MKRLTAAILSASLVLTMMAGCGNKSEETTGEEKAITVGTNSESGGLDPAGMIADTYLAYCGWRD